jgi:DNA repair protein RecO (recombination protein O)
MSEPRDYQTEAIVIKKTKLGEADRILTLYTPDHGKIEAVAKGVRKPKSKLAGHLELLTYSQVRLARGRNLETIIGSQTIDSFMALKNDLWLTSYGLYVAELVNQFTVAHAENTSLFRLFLESLNYLSRAANPELTLRYFEIRLMEIAGFRPQLHECVYCQAELKPVINTFASCAGGILCPDCQDRQPSGFPISLDALKVLRLFQRSDYSVVGRLKINKVLSNELKEILSGYIRYLLEREVKSATWLDSLREGMNEIAGGAD